MKILFLYILLVTSVISFRPTIGRTQSKENFANPDTTTVIPKVPEHLNAIVQSIAAVNEIQGQYVGFGGLESKNYKNYLQLKRLAPTGELINLTYHTNAVVACYASWVLADESYSDLPTIFERFLKNDRTVQTLSGCIRSWDNVSSQLYQRYWGKVGDTAKSGDKLLLQLDSIILYNDSSNWILRKIALGNRIYPSSYNPQIENLAFNKNSLEAIYYLCNWYRADYYERLKKMLVAYFQKTDFSNSYGSEYYRVLDELLRFRDPEIKPVIVRKLKTDTSWKNYEPWNNGETRFKSLLRSYDIYEID